MKKNMKKYALILVFILILGSLLAACGKGKEGEKKAADYPKKPITIIVPMSPGGTSDIGYRLIQPYLAKELGVDVVIENKPGASGQIGLTEGLNRPDDGYTVMHVHQSLTSASIRSQNAPYKLDDFAIVNTLHLDPECIAVKKDAPYQNLVELIQYIQAHPGEISMSATKGSASLALFYWIKDQLKLDFNIVPYDGGAPSRVACIGGHTNFVGTAVSDIYNDKDTLNAIAVGGKEESSLFPGVKTVRAQLKEFGIDAETVPSMPSWRSLAFKASFKEKHPEAFKIFLEAYERAYNNPEHLEAVKKANLEGIMHLCKTPEDAEKELRDIDKVYENYMPYLKK